MVKGPDGPDMTIAVDWNVKLQTKPNSPQDECNCCLGCKARNRKEKVISIIERALTLHNIPNSSDLIGYI